MYPLFLTLRLNIVFIPDFVFNKDELILDEGHFEVKHCHKIHKTQHI